eukprot:2023398-Amphidinium_carterae.1
MDRGGMVCVFGTLGVWGWYKFAWLPSSQDVLNFVISEGHHSNISIQDTVSDINIRTAAWFYDSNR